MIRTGRALVREDAGSASVVTAGIAAALVSIFAVLLGAAALVLARHQAHVAADLGAVAGAFALYRGEDACATAREVVALNRAASESCRVEGADVVVAASVRGRTAWAKAGPV